VIEWIELNVPGFGILKLEHLVSDYTGTLSLDGKLLPGIKEKLTKAAQSLKIHVLTADTFGTAKAELADAPCEVHIITGENLDVQKEDYVKKLGAEKVVAFGNGINDRKMLKVARLGIVVTGSEGCAVESLLAADVHVTNVKDGIDLLLNPKRLKAILRF